MSTSYRRRILAAGTCLLAAACADLPTGPEAIDGPATSSTSTAPDLAATPPGHIRIGVVPSATSITLGADGSWTLTDKETTETLFAGTDGDIEVTLLSAGEVRTRSWLQVVCTGDPATVEDLVDRASAAGFETFTQDLGFCVRVRFGTISEARPPAERQAFQEALAAAGLPSTGFWLTMTQVVDPRVQVAHGAEERIVTHPVVLKSDDGFVQIAGLTYRGIAEVWTNSSGTLAGINELPIEPYLYGVVPLELPPDPFGLPEAQKAQAVAARTFALANLGRRGADGYDLLPTTADQVYGGVEAEHPVSTAAVDETRGVVAVHEGQLISALFHSTSGGWTANSEDVFINALPYLRGVPDAERGEAVDRVPSLDVFMRHGSPTNLRAHAEGDFESDWSRLHRWTVEWTRAEMAQVVAASFGRPVTDVTAVEVTDRADHGRVRTLVVQTDVGELVASKDVIRSRLRYIDANGNHASLRSTLFFIEPLVDPGTREVTGWKAYGGGWGHGVGLGQTGAVGMAERGRTYEEILKHYYRGIELEQRQTATMAAAL